MVRKILLLLLAALVIIQFFQPEKNESIDIAGQANDISNCMAVSDTVQALLGTSCYDCHSNNTKYPWYAEVQPVGWWLSHHVNEGKKELNFNEFATYNLRRKYKKLEEIAEQVKTGEMPLSSYTIIHKDAVLNNDQKLLITAWANAARDSMKAHYPADSLIRKK
jgi:hypothetical protein